MLRKCYDNALIMHETKSRVLFNSDGTRTIGNGIAGVFWRGYDGTTLGLGYVDRSSKETMGYAYWRAGQDIKASEKA